MQYLSDIPNILSAFSPQNPRNAEGDDTSIRLATGATP
jgi:hypothetical protein